MAEVVAPHAYERFTNKLRDMEKEINTTKSGSLFQVKDRQSSYQVQVAQAFEAAFLSGTLTDYLFEKVELMTDGQSSLVYKLTDSKDKHYILKSAGTAKYLELEALFLNLWKSCGIRTPHIQQHGSIQAEIEVPYLLMEYVPGQSLLSVVEQNPPFYATSTRDMGCLQATMHQSKANGYGSAGSKSLRTESDSVSGCFATFREYFLHDELPPAIEFAQKSGQIQQSDFATIYASIDVLDADAKKRGASLTHNDFRAGNIIYNRTHNPPYTVIDPFPCLTHPYLCLAYTIILDEIHYGYATPDLKQGYGQVAEIDEAVLCAALLLKSVVMFQSFGRNKDSSYGRNLLQFFNQAKAKMRDQ